MTFKSIDEVFDGTLKLPGRGGKIYSIPEGDAEIGLWCTSLVSTAQQLQQGVELDPDTVPQMRFEGAQETAIQRRILGEELYAEMVADGLGKPTLDFIVSTVVIWHALGRDIAEHYWNAGGDGAVFQRAANRAARRGHKTSTSGAAVSTTPLRSSGSGTKSRKAK